jgi:hypothetical protein
MLLLVGIVLGFLLAASAFLVVRGFVGLFRRRSKSALAVLRGIVLFAVTVILHGVASYVLGLSSLDEAPAFASSKALVLGKNISALMNLSFFGLPFGVLAGLVAEIRAPRPPNKSLAQKGKGIDQRLNRSQ